MSYEGERTDTTLGELIAAVSDSALELSVNSQEAYLLASIVLERILKTRAQSIGGMKESGDDKCHGPITFH